MILNRKPVILVLVRSYLPGFRSGGPVRSVSNMVRALEDEYDFRIVCLDRDHGEANSYEGVVSSQWTHLGKSMVYYATDSEFGFELFRKLVQQIKPDLIYLNSLFDRDFSIKPLLCLGDGCEIPVLLAPRGELSLGALGLKAIRKQIFLTLVKLTRKYTQINWHATSATEVQRIRLIFSPLANRLFEASNLPDVNLQSELRKHTKDAGKLKIVLAARISPMKNTLGAIRIAGKLKGEVQLDLYGPLENQKYWEECQDQIRLCQPNVMVKYKGEAPHEELNRILQNYDVMLLPTMGENFGHSIIEALSAELPVIISDRTPWKNLMAAGVGAELPIEEESEFVRQLERLRLMDENEMQKVRNDCRKFVAEWRTTHIDLNAYRKMFDTIISSNQ